MTLPWAASVPVPLSDPAVSVVRPVAVSAVPAAIEVVARSSRLPRVCEPVTVPPAKTTVEAPGSMVPPTYVQLLAVLIVPARLRMPAGLLMTSGGRLPLAVEAAPVNVWGPAPSMRRVAVPPP